MGADFDTNSLHVVLTLYGATGYVMRAPPWKPACVQDDVTFLGMWGGELMSARALTVGQKQRVVFSRRGQDLSLYVDGSESCKRPAWPPTPTRVALFR